MEYKSGVSVIILTKNEEKNILDCLETVIWADQIIIIDDNSEDRTLEIVNNLQVKNIEIIQRELRDNFSEQRNHALTLVKHEWVLFVDADERVTEELRHEINDFVIEERNNSKYKGMYIKRRDVLWGKLLKHGEVGSTSLLRFAKADSGKWTGTVHEVWNVIDGETEVFENYILHFPHQTISDFLQELNYYTSLRAKELFEKKQSASILQIIFYPKAKFFVNFVLKLGFLDGIEGLIFAIMMSFHSFLVRAKLWTYSENKQRKS
jgi:glycosyltransferase involved in cell wall biosynthesis